MEKLRDSSEDVVAHWSSCLTHLKMWWLTGGDGVKHFDMLQLFWRLILQLWCSIGGNLAAHLNLFEDGVAVL